MRLDEILKRRIVEAKSKLGRDIFLYMSPREPADRFAQCGTCRLFTGSQCALLGADVPVRATSSCGLYAWGTPHEQPVRASCTAEEAGLVHHEVRCENCVSFRSGKCQLYETLNRTKPDLFDLDVNVEEKACCNAQTPRGR
jgi:hypothetical protein